MWSNSSHNERSSLVPRLYPKRNEKRGKPWHRIYVDLDKIYYNAGVLKHRMLAGFFYLPTNGYKEDTARLSLPRCTTDTMEDVLTCENVKKQQCE